MRRLLVGLAAEDEDEARQQSLLFLTLCVKEFYTLLASSHSIQLVVLFACVHTTLLPDHTTPYPDPLFSSNPVLPRPSPTHFLPSAPLLIPSHSTPLPVSQPSATTRLQAPSLLSTLIYAFPTATPAAQATVGRQISGALARIPPAEIASTLVPAFESMAPASAPLASRIAHHPLSCLRPNHTLPYRAFLTPHLSYTHTSVSSTAARGREEWHAHMALITWPHHSTNTWHSHASSSRGLITCAPLG